MCIFAASHSLTSQGLLNAEQELYNLNDSYRESIGTSVGLLTAPSWAQPLAQLALRHRHDTGCQALHAQ